jgi:hypothetical protein
MEDSTPDGEHMTMDTFKQVLDFALNLNPLILLISGGEPTEHPMLFDFLDLIEQEKIKRNIELAICITSNGMFINKGKEYFDKLVSYPDVSIQVTNDKRFYPTRIEVPTHPKISYETELRILEKLGRAKDNWDELHKKGNMPRRRIAPSCFNIRSICNSFSQNGKYSFRDVILFLVMHHKFCQPMIDIDGTIRIGETRYCYPVGNVHNSCENIIDNIASADCNNCGFSNKTQILEFLRLNPF